MPSTKVMPAKKDRRLSNGAKPVPTAVKPPPPTKPILSEIRPAIGTVLQTMARLITVEPGLHVLTVGPTGVSSNMLEGIGLPAIQITSPPSNQFDPVEIMTAWNDTGAWLGQSGGVVVLRSPPGGGHLLITTYAEPDRPQVFPEDIDVRPLDQIANGNSHAESRQRPIPAKRAVPLSIATPPVQPPVDPREAAIQITLHIARQGDRTFPARGWAGNLGGQMQIEAFSISPRSKLSPDDIEYKAFGPQGRETRWTSGGKLCGTRGRGLPLTGFAVQTLPHVSERFDVIYQGAFFDSGITEPSRNGASCLPARPDDILEAINLRIVEREGS